MSNKDLEECSLFRIKKRIPTLTYRHKNGFCIWRSSQTKSGFSGANKSDVLLLTKIARIRDGGFFPISKLIDVQDAQDAYLKIYGSLFEMIFKSTIDVLKFSTLISFFQV